MEGTSRSNAEHNCAEDVESHEQTDLPVGAENHSHSGCYQVEVKCNLIEEAPPVFVLVNHVRNCVPHLLELIFNLFHFFVMI